MQDTQNIDPQNIDHFLDNHTPLLGDQIKRIIKGVGEAGKKISVLLAMGSLDQKINEVDLKINVQGEDQFPLDVLSNDIFLKVFKKDGSVAAVASEEMEEAVPFANTGSPYILLFDPLDGSSNLEINGPVGSIFSIIRIPDGRTEFQEDDIFQPGNQQVGAGYLLYGSSTMLVLSLGNGVDGFTLNPETNEFIHTDRQMKVAPETQEFAINVSNMRFWNNSTRLFIDECLKGKLGEFEKDFNMRWVASFVSDIHRILKRSGIFMYPRDNKNLNIPGRLRLLYELNPMSYIITQAGGLATSGQERILDIIPNSLHQRVGAMIGSKNEIEIIERYYELHDKDGEVYGE